MTDSVLRVNVCDENGDDRFIELEARAVECWDCRGKGSTYLGWTSRDQPAFTGEDLDREGPEFTRDMMSGAYDKRCPTCKGKRTVMEAISKPDDPDWEAYQVMLQDDADFAAERDAERRMGC